MSMNYKINMNNYFLNKGSINDDLERELFEEMYKSPVPITNDHLKFYKTDRDRQKFFQASGRDDMKRSHLIKDLDLEKRQTNDANIYWTDRQQGDIHTYMALNRIENMSIHDTNDANLCAPRNYDTHLSSLIDNALVNVFASAIDSSRYSITRSLSKLKTSVHSNRARATLYDIEMTLSEYFISQNSRSETYSLNSSEIETKISRLLKGYRLDKLESVCQVYRVNNMDNFDKLLILCQEFDQYLRFTECITETNVHEFMR